jgi:hypothetical protein
MKTHAIALVLALTAAVGLGAVGCSQKVSGTFLPNQRPVVRLTWAPIKPPDPDPSHRDSSIADFYIYKMNWTGYDPDGRVVSFQYVVDPPTAADSDTQWVTTTRNEETIPFRASKSDPVKSDSLRTDPAKSRDFHVFVIRAVDNRGAVSEPVARAFFSFGVAPVVTIQTPSPSYLINPQVTPAFQVTWTGKDFIDPYGTLFEKPVKYKYKLYKIADMPSKWVTQPDTMRAAVAPAFAGWDSCGGDTTQVQYTSQTPGSEYLFVIVAIGRSGAYSPIFRLDTNMLRMYVGLAGKAGPVITMYNSFFTYVYPSGGFPSPLDPSWAVQLQVPAEQVLTFNWLAEPPPGSVMKRYRWVLDLVNLDDETPRVNQSDWYHWSPWSANGTSATVGPFTGVDPTDPTKPEQHNLYVEAEDINGLVSLGWVQFTVIKPSFEDSLLVVDDTRLEVDQIYSSSRPDTIRAPIGPWPTRAEMDTFLFAVGGVRWKMTPSTNPKLSPQGLFKGYPFDTFGTRRVLENPSIPLSTLGKYSHVIWMTDKAGAEFTVTMSRTQPITTLRYMSKANRQNTLGTWVQQGGKLWALGGGFGHATNADWNNPNGEDDKTARTYSTIDPATNPDLRPGRFMYDITHWRSEFRVFSFAAATVVRVDQPDPISRYPRPPRKWQGAPLRDPSYSVLPTTLKPRNAIDDLTWPRPGAQFPGASWPIDYEFLTEDNVITEPAGDPPIDYPTLDTLYLIFGSNPAIRYELTNPDQVNAIMTYYHGADNAPMVFSGFNIWLWRRQDCLTLVDFVLHTLWHQPLPPRTAVLARAQPRPGTSQPAAAPVRRSVQQPLRGAVRQPAGTTTSQRLR